jgi:uncharacterized protein (DUF2141 family)
MKISILRYILPIILVVPILFTNCANPMPPPGGPADTTAPVILEFFPAESSTNFLGESVTMEFSKYMNKTQVTDNIFLSPQKEMQFDWSGKELEIEFIEELDSNTTYALLLGTEYTDWKGNKPQESFTLTFSTGNKIDSGYFRGRLVDKNPSGAFIYAYRIDNIDPDTLNPANSKPQYRTQTGTTGNFKISALKDGKYRFFAIRDVDKDGVYTEGRDPIGPALSDVDVSKDSISVVNLRLGPSIDKARPQLYGADAMFSNRIVASFSEKLDTVRIRKEAFELTDSAGQEKIEILGAYPGSDHGFVELIINEKLDTNKTYKLTSLPGEFAIRDSSMNMIDDTANVAYFYPNPEPDTLKYGLVNVNVRDSLKKYIPRLPFRFIYNTSISIDDPGSVFKLSKDGKPLEIELMQIAENIYDIIPKSKLQSETWYNISYNPTAIKDQFGKALVDTSFSYDFETGDIGDYANLAGVVLGVPAADQKYFIEAKDKDGKNSFIVPLPQSREFLFEEVPPGIYKFSVFLDIDGDGSYSHGDVFPYKFAEPFVEFNKEFELKARWNVEDIRLNWVQ